MKNLIYFRHCLRYLTLAAFLCLVVILPLNFMGSNEGDRWTFGHTTLSNLAPNIDALWVHHSMSFILFVTSICCMLHFAATSQFRFGSINKTLFIENLPEDIRVSKSKIQDFFNVAFPQFVVKTINLVYDVSKLHTIKYKLTEAVMASEKCKEYTNKQNTVG